MLCLPQPGQPIRLASPSQRGWRRRGWATASAVIDRAIEWERRSGATFEKNKIIIIYFIRRPDRTSIKLFTIKSKAIALKKTTKILGVIIDSRLRYTQYIGKATTKSFLAAIILKRLRLVSFLTIKQLFRSTVAPIIDYISNV